VKELNALILPRPQNNGADWQVRTKHMENLIHPMIKKGKLRQ